MAVLCGMNTIQYSAQNGPLIGAQAVYFLHSTMPSATCLRLSDVSFICRVTCYQFSIQVAFFPCLSARQHSGVVVYPILDIGRCRKFW